jgi:ABC-type multidrug transport system fused ATPase/permease subunit
MNNNTELQNGAEIIGGAEMADGTEGADSTQVMVGDGAAIEIPLPVSTVGVYQPGARNVRPSATPSQPAERLPEQTLAQNVATPAAVRDPELYAAWKTHIENGFTNNQLMFQQLLNGFMNPYWTTVWMYRILFGLGVASFLVAAGLSAFTGKEGYTLVFGGLSALSLLAYFFNRPLQALEENLQFITWLGLIYNSYWTRLVYLNSQPDVQKELQDATDDAIQRIKELMEVHAQSSGRRETLPKQ